MFWPARAKVRWVAGDYADGNRERARGHDRSRVDSRRRGRPCVAAARPNCRPDDRGGLLRGRPETNPFTPDNQPDENVWYWVQLDAMAARAGVPPLPFYVEAGPAANPGGLPIGGRPVVELANNHLQYAITWYGLAAGLLAVYVFYRRGERRRPTDS